MRELRAFARDYRRRADALDREQERLREDRDAAILRACDVGVPQTDIAEALGVSQQLVSKVIRSRR
jgi:DNA-binding MarR family transcriptional regulator